MVIYATPKVLRSAGTYFVARMLAAFIALAATSIYTRLLSPAEYGVYALALSSVFMAYGCLMQWLTSSLARFLPMYPARQGVLLSHIVVGYFAVALIVVSVILISTCQLVVSTRLMKIIGVSVGLFLAIGFAELCLVLFQINLKPLLHAQFTLLRAAGAVIAGVSLAYLGYGSLGLLVGLLVGNFCIIVPNLGRHWRPVRLTLLDKRLVRDLAAYGFPSAMIGALGTVMYASDRYIIAALMGAELTGLYAAPYDLAMRSLQVLMLVVAMAYNPVILRAYEAEGRTGVESLIRRQAELLLGVALPAAIGFVMLSPAITHLLLGQAFQEIARKLIPWVAVATVLSGMQTFYLALPFTLTKRPLSQTAVFALGALVNVLLNFALIPPLGLVGAAFATVIAYALILVCSFVLGRRLFPLTFPGVGLAKIVVACAAWALILWPVRGTTAVAPVLLHGLAGGAAYVAVFCALDVGGTRRLFGRVLQLASAPIREWRG